MPFTPFFFFLRGEDWFVFFALVFNTVCVHMCVFVCARAHVTVCVHTHTHNVFGHACATGQVWKPRDDL